MNPIILGTITGVIVALIIHWMTSMYKKNKKLICRVKSLITENRKLKSDIAFLSDSLSIAEKKAFQYVDDGPRLIDIALDIVKNELSD